MTDPALCTYIFIDIESQLLTTDQEASGNAHGQITRIVQLQLTLNEQTLLLLFLLVVVVVVVVSLLILILNPNLSVWCNIIQQ